MKNVVFIRLAPWFYYPIHHPQDIIIPFDIAYIAAMIDEKRYHIHIIDNYVKDFSVDNIVTEILNRGVDILGISSKTPSIKAAIEIFERIKKKKPSVKTFATGQHVTYMPETVLNNSFHVDAAVIGESELTVLELFDSFANGINIEHVNGIAYWDKVNNIMVKTQQREPIRNLDSLPFMKHEIFDGLGYKKISMNVQLFKKAKWGFLQSSRGCPYQCIFCSDAIRASYGKAYRARSPELVVNEMEYLVNKLGVNAIDFIDEVFTLDMNRAEEICDEIIKRRLKVKWTVATRADRLHKTLLRKMRLAGCSSIAIGVESGSDRILKMIKKGQTKEQIRDAVRSIHDESMSTNLTFIIGHPTETYEEMLETFNFARELMPMFIQLHYLTPYPGTEIREDNKWREDVDFDEYSHFNICRQNVSNIPDKVLKYAISNFYKKYYFSFLYLLTYLKYRAPYAIFNPGIEYQLIKSFIKYIWKG